MNNDLTRQFLDACHEARRICEILPNLPERLKPRHIRIIRCIHIIYEEKGDCPGQRCGICHERYHALHYEAGE